MPRSRPHRQLTTADSVRAALMRGGGETAGAEGPAGGRPSGCDRVTLRRGQPWRTRRTSSFPDRVGPCRDRRLESTDTGKVHLFFLIGCRMSLIWPRPCRTARERAVLGQSCGPSDGSWRSGRGTSRGTASVEPPISRRDIVAKIDVRHVPLRDGEGLVKAVMLPCACV